MGLLGNVQPQNPFYGASSPGGLLGLGGIGALGGPSIPTGLLGSGYDPRELRRLQLKRFLLGASASLLGGGKGSTGEVIGQGLAGGLQGADQAQQDYMAQAQLQQKLQLEADQRQREADTRKKQQDWIAGLPASQQGLASAFPQVAATQAADQMFAPPSKPNNQITDINGNRVLIDQNTGNTVKILGDSPARQASVPTGYREKKDGSGNIERIPGYKDVQLETDIRKDFDSQTKDFRSVRDSYNRVQASTENPTPAGDLSLIFNYMKMLDPNSVVREGEFATAAAAGSFGDQVRDAVSRVTTGQRLTPEQRADFLGKSQALYSEQEQTFNGLADQYTETAKRNGLDPANIILTPKSNPRKPVTGNSPISGNFKWTPDKGLHQ